MGCEMTLTPERVAELHKTMTNRVESGWMTVDTWPVLELIDLLAEKDAEIERLRVSEDEYAAINRRMSDLLTQTATALKG